MRHYNITLVLSLIYFDIIDISWNETVFMTLLCALLRKN